MSSTENADLHVAQHPLLQVARVIVQHIHDYPSLVLFSNTCYGFRAAVQSCPAIVIDRFDKLEAGRKYGGYVRQGDCFYNYKKNNLMGHPAGVFLEHQDLLGHYRLISFSRQEFRLTDVEIDFDIFRFNCGQLRSFDWVPCYRCRTIKRRKSEFFWEYGTRISFRPFEGDPGRLCIACCLADPTWTSKIGYVPRVKCKTNGKPPTLRLFPHPTRYLQEMPLRTPGFRLKCSHCQYIEWVMYRPRKRQCKEKMCSECYKSSLQKDSFDVECSRLMAISFEPERIRRRPQLLKLDVTECVEDEPLKFGGLYGFDLLREVIAP